jgi:hypothetical protein
VKQKKKSQSFPSKIGNTKLPTMVSIIAAIGGSGVEICLRLDRPNNCRRICWWGWLRRYWCKVLSDFSGTKEPECLFLGSYYRVFPFKCSWSTLGGLWVLIMSVGLRNGISRAFLSGRSMMETQDIVEQWREADEIGIWLYGFALVLTPFQF